MESTFEVDSIFLQANYFAQAAISSRQQDRQSSCPDPLRSDIDDAKLLTLALTVIICKRPV